MINFTYVYDPQASQSNVGSSDVEIVPTTQKTDENSKAKPKIAAIQIPVGFGNDINESKTVEMMNILLKRIGNVRMFAGADYADYISLRIHTDSWGKYCCCFLSYFQEIVAVLCYVDIICCVS